MMAFVFYSDITTAMEYFIVGCSVTINLYSYRGGTRCTRLIYHLGIRLELDCQQKTKQLF